MLTVSYTKPCEVLNVKELSNEDGYEEDHEDVPEDVQKGQEDDDTDNTDTDGKRCPAFLDGDEEDPESSQNYSKKTYFDNRKRKKCPYCGTNMNQLSYAVSYSIF
jgi:hypothetical protein